MSEKKFELTTQPKETLLDKSRRIASENNIHIDNFLEESHLGAGAFTYVDDIVLEYLSQHPTAIQNGIQTREKRCFIPLEAFNNIEVITLLREVMPPAQQQSSSSSSSSSSTSSISSQLEDKKQKTLKENQIKIVSTSPGLLTPTAATSGPPTLRKQKSPTDAQRRWLEDAKKGNVSELKKALTRGQAIDQAIDGQTALQVAISTGQSSTVQFLLDNKARCDVLTSQGTAVITALQQRDYKLLGELTQTPSGKNALNTVHIEGDVAKQHLLSYPSSEACYTPLTYAMALFDRDREKEITDDTDEKVKACLTTCLSRPAFWPVMPEPAEDKIKTSPTTAASDSLSELYQFYVFYYDPAQPDRNRDLLCYAITRLTGQNIHELLETIPYDSLEGAYKNENRTMLGNESPSWQHEPFLTLRIGSLFALRCALTIGSEKDFKKFTQVSKSKSEFQERLDHLIVIELEMLRTAQEIRALPLLGGKPTALTQAGYRQIAYCLRDKIVALADGEEYPFAFSWYAGLGAHAIYMSWMRRGEEIIWRVDNLDKADKDRHSAQQDGDSQLLLQSALIGKCKRSDLSKPAYMDHFIQLAQAFKFPLADKGKNLAYKPSDKLGLTPVDSKDPLRKSLPHHLIQVRSNCYVKSHEPGFWQRSKQDKLLFDYTQTQEPLNAKAWLPKSKLTLRQCWTLENEREKNPVVKPELEEKKTSSISPLNPATTADSFFHISSSSSSTSSSAMPTTSSKLPSHEDLLKHLMDKLGCRKEDVRQGIAIEQSLVELAGITTGQNGARFWRGDDGCTHFRLCLDASDFQEFQAYFLMNHEGFIKNCQSQQGYREFQVDTNMLYHEVADALAKRRHQAQSSSGV